MNQPRIDPASGNARHDPAIVQKHLEDGAKGHPGRPIPDVPLAQHVNNTPFPCQYFHSLDQDGEVFHVVALRVTFDMRSTLPDGSLAYAAQQTPLATQDEWSSDVNVSSPLWESDYAPFKPKCDVLIANAVSRPPGDQASQRWPCGVALKWQAGREPKAWSKQLTVTGPRRFGVLGLSQPHAANAVDIHWQHAYGGQVRQPQVDEIRPDGTIGKRAGSDRWDTDERNPVGAGFNKASGQPGPQLEVLDQPYVDGLGQGDYPPVGLSALGRAWLPRRTLAGTYDDAWLKDQWPLPPMDFDDAYWNCAPQDQQVDYLPPGTEILLLNLYPPGQQAGPAFGDGKGLWKGRLPMHDISVRLVMRIGGHNVVHDVGMQLDTLVIDLAQQQIYATHRYVLGHSAVQGHQLVRLENWLSHTGHPYELVGPAELGPLGKVRC